MVYTISFKKVNGSYDQVKVGAKTLLEAVVKVQHAGAVKILSIDVEDVPQVCYNTSIETNN